jgi:hypothetical protein
VAKPASPEAIAKWADKQVRSAHTPAYKRLTDTDRILITRLHKQGLSQVEIAQRLGCDQSSVSRWLSACQDSTTEATAYLRGQSLRMARHIVEKGRAADQVQVLKGFTVIPQDQQPAHGPQIVINGFVLSGLGLSSQGETQGPVVEGQVLSPPLTEDMHSLSVENTEAKVNTMSLIRPNLEGQAEADPGAGIAGDPTPVG